jgi:hypothetical protein
VIIVTPKSISAVLQSRGLRLPVNTFLTTLLPEAIMAIVKTGDGTETYLFEKD